MLTSYAVHKLYNWFKVFKMCEIFSFCLFIYSLRNNISLVLPDIHWELVILFPFKILTTITMVATETHTFETINATLVLTTKRMSTVNTALVHYNCVSACSNYSEKNAMLKLQAIKALDRHTLCQLQINKLSL